jgi:ribonucleotide reductase alpha subunit
MMFSESANLVLRRRYLLNDEATHPAESPDDMFRRVAAKATPESIL